MTSELAALPDLMPALPEILLAVGAMVLLMIGAFGGPRTSQMVTGLAVALLIIAGAILLLSPGGTVVTFNGAFIQDPFSRLMKILVLVGSGVALAMSVGFSRVEKFETIEFPVLILLATLGMMMMLSANDMIAVYLALELQSLALYVVASIKRDSTKATEAGLKYFVLGALSSGMLLYGMSLIYGFTGQTSFAGIAEALHTDEAGIGAIFGLVFILAGLTFKISAVPFHMWTPDVYEGAPTPVTAFLAAAPKVAAMGLIVRVVFGAFEPFDSQWQQVIIFVSMLSMVLGSFAAIGQRNIKRLMAYSSIGHMGYALVGLAAGSAAGVEGVIIYMIIYVVMTLGAFAAILSMRRKDGMVESIDDLSGLSKTDLPMAFLLSVIMFSLAGIPWMGGFFGKFFVFLAAVEAGLYPLAIIGVLASVVGAYYYLRIVKIMFFDDPAPVFEKTSVELRLVLVLCGLFVFSMVVFIGPIRAMAEAAAKSFF
ncbi:NADH-quinone oxidoreductase subunit NuoN [Cohaesibacter celericrescens]|uniref:NADH-quinone oxidoreductase subunit N n=1 Tax=Cohaesibacter celericrescens TaxID=2067669 RepID=A0A2N5XSU1_9HYPH|nr:NADH-quinone oxidoreductase subunit NuoN [Cohaesibacter celericrescens]PLW77478.1 NADH-quinone oxidoreductase subunit NuoN [Cohaesibacter celericrescens]